MGDPYTANETGIVHLNSIQRSEIETTLKKRPVEVGIAYFNWTPKLVSLYIQKQYGLKLSKRTNQRLLRKYGILMSEQKVKAIYEKLTKRLNNNSEYEVWHIRNFIVWKYQSANKSENLLKSKKEGVIIAYKQKEKKFKYIPYDGSYEDFSKKIDYFIDENKSNCKMTIVYQDNSDSQKKIKDMYINNQRYKGTSTICKPEICKEERDISEKVKLVYYEIEWLDYEEWKSFPYKLRNCIREIIEG